MALHHLISQWIPSAVAVTALLVSSHALAADDVTRFAIEFYQHGSAEPMNHATIWVSGQRVRIEQRKPGAIESGPVLIFRGDDQLVLSVSERAQQYSKIERSMLRMLGMKPATIEQRAMKRATDGQLKSLPRDQREALERVLGLSRSDAKRAPLSVDHSPDESVVAGVACERVVMRRAESVVGDACIASWPSVGFEQSELEVFRSLANFQRTALGSRGVTPVEFVPDQAFDLIVQFDGFPLSFRKIVNDQERSAIRVASIDRVPADDALFSAPDGYALRRGYDAFFEHLSAIESVESNPASLARQPVAPSPQPAASPASQGADRERYGRRYRSISILP